MVLIIRIPLLRVLFSGPLFSEAPAWPRGYLAYPAFASKRLGGLGPQGRAWDPGFSKGCIRVNPIKLETGLRPNSAGISYTLLLRTEAMEFPTFVLKYRDPK